MELVCWTARTIEFASGPRFAGNAGALGSAIVAVETFGGHAKVHGEIRSWTAYCREGQKRVLKEDQMGKQFVNYYRCPEDGHEWADVWSCRCNDMCPSCHLKDIEPYKSEEIVHTKINRKRDSSLRSE
jgi:hypothetical protein